jgi:anionic cell wall polymer biosynthesis LytR-Cps2A-Psr (LCP) family protein
MTIQKKHIFLIIIIIFGILATVFFIQRYVVERDARRAEQARKDAISEVIHTRTASDNTTSTDPFFDTDTVRILLIGLDTRAGSDVSHCDAIQLVEITKSTETIVITAVPRGTYAPLPPGTAVTSSEYYVSNSCALGGIEYGIANIQKILGVEADYVAFIGFSELMGALRTLRLPATDTLQWLRHRQGYAIGEPQRARNHSTFLKTMLVRFTPDNISKADTTLHYLLYQLINTDMSFAMVQSLVQTLSDMRIYERPDAITLAMRPAYDVEDIAYDPNEAGAYVTAMVTPVSSHLNAADYQELTEADISTNVITLIEDKHTDSAFITWAWDHKLWFQLSEEQTRLEVQYELLTHYLNILETTEARQAVLGDYVLEMKFLGYTDWATKGEDLIAAELAL